MEPWAGYLPRCSNDKGNPFKEAVYRLLHTLSVWVVRKMTPSEQHKLLPKALPNPEDSDDDDADDDDDGSELGGGAFGTLQAMLSKNKRRAGTVSDLALFNHTKKEVSEFMMQDWKTVPTEQLAESANPCEWWRLYGEQRFPVLALVAKRLFGILPSSAEAERFASTAGNTCNADRCALN